MHRSDNIASVFLEMCTDHFQNRQIQKRGYDNEK